MRLFTHDFVFSNRRRHRLARHAAFWGVYTVFSGILYGFVPISLGIPERFHIPVWLVFVSSFGDALLFNLNHALLTYLILYVLMPRFLFKGRYLALAAGLVGCVALSVVTSTTISATLVQGYHRLLGDLAAQYLDASVAMGKNPFASRNSLVGALMAGLRGGITIAGFAAAIKLGKHWYLKQEALRQTEKAKLTAELQLLKAQVHPHFLFNTLNNLYALTLAKSDRSPGVVLKLSGLLSYMLYECNVPEVPLEKEIGVLCNYLELEQMRYGDRVEVSLNIAGDIPGRRIAPLLLLPFVENAFKHGSSEQIEKAWISLSLMVDNDTLRFKLLNSKNETLADAPGSTGGIGLQNVRKRLELIYPGRFDLKLSARPDIFIVSLVLSLDRADMAGRPSFPSVPIATPIARYETQMPAH